MSLLDAMLLESHRDKRDLWIALRTDGVKGSGTEQDPFNGGTWEHFDGLMRGFMAQNVEFISIHLGPGVFESKGTAPYDINQGWEIRRGWKIVGSGIEVTVLKVVGAVDLGGLIVAIGQKAFTSVADYAEVMDLTVDCNLPIPPDPLPPLEEITPKVAIAAVALKGSHTRIRRVRAIHFGTYQMFTEGDPRNQPECFVISAGGRGSGLPEPTDCRIEECIVEHRAPNIPGRNNITCLSISAGEVARTGIMEHPRAGVIRNCYVNGAVMWDGTGYTPANPFNGAFSIATVAGEPTKFTYQMGSVPENNPFPAVIAEKVSTGAVSFGAPMVRNGSTVTYTTVYPHGLLAGEGVDILEARVSNEAEPNAYTGTLDIIAVSSPTQFTYVLKNAPEGLPDPAGSPQFRALWQVGMLVCENNVIELAPSTSGTPHGIVLIDTLSHVGPYVFRRLVFRNNVIRHIAGVSDPNAKAIRIEYAESGLVENNLIDLPNLHPIDFKMCKSIRFFNNRTSSGKLIRGFNVDTGRYADELETRIEDAVAMAFL